MPHQSNLGLLPISLGDYRSAVKLVCLISLREAWHHQQCRMWWARSQEDLCGSLVTFKPVSMTLLKIGSPVNLRMADEEEEGPKEDPLGPLMQNLRKKQAEGE